MTCHAGIYRYAHMCLCLAFPGDMGPLHELFESWISGEEDWRKSQTFIRITSSDGNINSDLRDWLTRAELQQKVGEEAAKEMINHLETHNPEKCRYHPDAPGVEETAVFFCFMTTQNVTGSISKMLTIPFIPPASNYCGILSPLKASFPKCIYGASSSGVQAIQSPSQRLRRKKT